MLPQETILVEDVNSDNGEENDDCGKAHVSNVYQGSIGMEVPDMISDKEGRPMRRAQPSERYDPTTGKSYVQQVECFHNLMAQKIDPNLTLQDEEG